MACRRHRGCGQAITAAAYERSIERSRLRTLRLGGMAGGPILERRRHTPGAAGMIEDDRDRGASLPMMSLRRLLLGRRLANREQAERKIGALEGVPAMGLDGLGSAAYGPEAALTILLPLGAAGLAVFVPIIAVIVGLLAILFASYWQTIRAYPSNGGAYVVSKDNLGVRASLVAASALMVDYVLNVAVGISAGVGALVSAVPALHAYTLPLCLAILIVVALANLRGTLDAGRLFALPTYTFVASFLLILTLGTYAAIAAGGAPHPVVPPPALPAGTGPITLWLVLRAFASGCTAMTGVEAVSNGMTAFKEPVIRYGHRTLTVIVVSLGLLLGGVAYLVRAYRIGAMDQEHPGYQSVLSQLAHAVVGHGVFYDVAIGSLLCVLTLSANTSFVDFPRLCRMVAQDGFLPRPFAIAGRRLVFSVGILYLAVAAGILLVVFRGITDRLIPLFAIGAFLTFTLSQSGMVVHWRRARRSSRGARPRNAHRLHLVLNALGASATGVALVIIVAAKFTEGAWITVLVIPGVVALLTSIKRYYDQLDASLHPDGPLSFTDVDPPVVLVATQRWNKLTDKALGFALRLSPDIYAVHLTKLEGPDGDDDAPAIRDRWAKDVEAPARAAGLRPPRLLLLRSDYRVIDEPLLKLVKQLQDELPHRTIAVLLPEVVKTTWWQVLLHTHRARRLRSRLLRFGGSLLVIIHIPWYLKEPRIEQGIGEAPMKPSRDDGGRS
jgi:amino acid transporter